MPKELTLEDLKQMETNSIFVMGEGYIPHPWFNDATVSLESDGYHTRVKFVAITGNIGDWAIYHSLDANITQADFLDSTEHLNASVDKVARTGAKLHDREYIRKLVPCTDEALKKYRD